MKLIQALYDLRTPLPDDLSFYQHAIEDIEMFEISSQVYFLLQQKGQLDQTPQFFQNRLKQKYNETLYKNIFLKNQTGELLRRFEEKGIDVIPLKGIMFTEKYFGYVGARATSDIDLLIKRPDLEKASECVREIGYTIEQERIRSHFHASFSKELPSSPIPLTVETHWNILKEKTASFNINELWKQATTREGSIHIKELSEYHTFYMICLHGWRHNLCSLKYFLDIIQMIHFLSRKLDFSVLLQDVASHKTMKRIIRTLSIVYQQFPHLENINNLPHKRKNLWWEYDAMCNLGGKTFNKYVDFIDYHIFSYDSPKHSLLEILDCILHEFVYQWRSFTSSDHKRNRLF